MLLIFKVLVQLIDGQRLLLCACKVGLNLAILEDNQPITIGEGVFEVVGNHQGRQVVLGDPLVRGMEEVQTGVRVKGRGVFIQEQDVWTLQSCYQETQRLPLPTGEGSRCRSHPVFQTVVHGSGQFSKAVHVLLELTEN